MFWDLITFFVIVLSVLIIVSHKNTVNQVNVFLYKCDSDDEKNDAGDSQSPSENSKVKSKKRKTNGGKKVSSNEDVKNDSDMLIAEILES